MKLSKLTAMAFGLGLAALPAAALDLSEMSAAEREVFREEVRAYLLDNPEVIMEAVAILEQRQAANEAAADDQLVASHAAALFEDGYSWVGGNPEGDITLVEFIDYRCGYCRKAHDEVKELVAQDGNIRLIMKEFPILGDASMASSRFAIAVKQIAGADAYEAANDALIRFNADANERSLKRLAKTLGLDADAIIAHMDSEAVTEEIRQTRALAQQLRISGTPTFVLQDEMLRGYLPLDAMREIVSQKRG